MSAINIIERDILLLIDGAYIIEKLHCVSTHLRALVIDPRLRQILRNKDEHGRSKRQRAESGETSTGSKPVADKRARQFHREHAECKENTDKRR